jgi:hypothetical protein
VGSVPAMHVCGAGAEPPVSGVIARRSTPFVHIPLWMLFHSDVELYGRFRAATRELSFMLSTRTRVRCTPCYATRRDGEAADADA